MKELELFSLDGLGSWFRRNRHDFVPEPGQRCLNCETELQGRFCHVCGQDADVHHRTIGHLIFEAFEGLFHLDGRLWQTLPPLFFAPGKLARDILDGRFARHVPPFRIFLVALLVFMFAAEHKSESLRHESGHPAASHQPAMAAFGFSSGDFGAGSSTAASEDASEDPVVAGLGEVAKSQGTVIRKVNKDGSVTETRNVQLFAMNDEQSRLLANALRTSKMKPAWLKDGLVRGLDNPEVFFHSIFTWGHRLALLLLPIMGVSLGMIYAGKRYRRKFYLYDHLLIAMNMLSFVFFLNAIGFVLPDVVMKPWGELLFTVWTLANFFMTLRGGYGSSIAGAIVKSLFLWLMTGIAFGIVIVTVVLISLVAG